jgi:hypothetical protein
MSSLFFIFLLPNYITSLHLHIFETKRKKHSFINCTSRTQTCTRASDANISRILSVTYESLVFVIYLYKNITVRLCKNITVRLDKILNLRKFFTDCFAIFTQRCIRIRACFNIPMIYRCHT